jgi:hypothetical protein
MISKNKVLATLSVLHSVIGFIVVLSILSFSFEGNTPILDLISAMVPLSFLLFNRCIHLDFYEYIKCDSEIPEYATDGYYFNKLQVLLFGKEIMSKPEINEFKGGKVTDISHFCDLDDPDIIKDIYNEKIHYIVINCILIVILLTKYNQKKLIPLFLIWFFVVFSN